MNRVLIINEEAKNDAKKVKAYADAHRVHIRDLMRMLGGSLPSVGDNPEHSMGLIDGWWITYSIEEQVKGWCHHISISIDQREKNKSMPHEVGVHTILELFGIDPKSDPLAAWIDEGPPPNDKTPPRKALNFLFPLGEQKA